MDLTDYREGLGVDMRFDSATNFNIFAVTSHNHFNDSENPCSYRYGIMVTVLGVALAFGWFRNYPNLP